MRHIHSQCSNVKRCSRIGLLILQSIFLILEFTNHILQRRPNISINRNSHGTKSQIKRKQEIHCIITSYDKISQQRKPLKFLDKTQIRTFRNGNPKSIGTSYNKKFLAKRAFKTLSKIKIMKKGLIKSMQDFFISFLFVNKPTEVHLYQITIAMLKVMMVVMLLMHEMVICL